MDDLSALGESSQVPTIQTHIYHIRRALAGKQLAANEVIMTKRHDGKTAYALGDAGYELLKLWEGRG
jgi:hypothetical protein